MCKISSPKILRTTQSPIFLSVVEDFECSSLNSRKMVYYRRNTTEILIVIRKRYIQLSECIERIYVLLLTSYLLGCFYILLTSSHIHFPFNLYFCRFGMGFKCHSLPLKLSGKCHNIWWFTIRCPLSYIMVHVITDIEPNWRISVYTHKIHTLLIMNFTTTWILLVDR